MSDPTDENILGVRDLRIQLGHRIDAAHYREEPTVVTKSGEPRAVLVSYAWYKQHESR